jgi:O-antigen ligase
MRLAIHEAHVLGATGFLTPLLAAYAPRALAVLAVTAAVGGAIARRAGGRGWPIPQGRVVWIIAAATFWALVTIAWGIEAKPPALWGLARLTIVVSSGLVLVHIAASLAPAERAVVRRLLVAGVLLVLVLLTIDRLTDASIRRLWSLSPAFHDSLFIMEVFNRGIAVLALVSFPFALALSRRVWVALIAWGAIFALALSLPSGAAQLALMLGAVAAVCAWMAPRAAAGTFAVLLVTLTLVAPLVAAAIPPPDKMPSRAELPISYSGHHRLQIWRFTADRILERPILGWGYDSSRRIPGSSAMIGFSEAALPLHPHNAPLQWWLELGAPGAALGGALLAAIALAIRRRAALRTVTAASLGQLTCAVTLASLSFGTWQGWWVGAIGIAAALLAASTDDS